MANYISMSKNELLKAFVDVKKHYEELKNNNLSLDMSRGKPGFDQLDLCGGLLDTVGEKYGYIAKKGTDCRNYGGLEGIDELRALFGQVLGVEYEDVICGGNSSLQMMFDTITQGMITGFGDKPWHSQGKIKFLCPSPGYDRHFAICEYYGIEMITIQTNPDGPDMDSVEEYVKDPSVKGMWCVPKYSNPEGITYSDEVVKRIAALKPAAKDFRVMWDNAYAIHDLYDEGDKLLNIYEECKKLGNEDLVIMFTSTSKISYPGAGIAVEAASPLNMQIIKSRMRIQTIGPNKLNQLMHARMFSSYDKLISHMKRHASVLRPKFEAVLKALNAHLKGTGIAEWKEPRGGYFISLNVLEGCAKRVGELCKEAGLTITTPGATYPYGKDPKDSNLRIAPSFPSVAELEKAAEVLCIAVKYACLEKLMSKGK